MLVSDLSSTCQLHQTEPQCSHLENEAGKNLPCGLLLRRNGLEHMRLVAQLWTPSNFGCSDTLSPLSHALAP